MWAICIILFALFWDKLNGDQLRADAHAHAQALWDFGELTGWADAELVIEQHSAHDLVHEGLEGLGWEVGSAGDSDSDDDDHDDDEDSEGGDLGEGGVGESDAPADEEDLARGADGGDEPPAKKSRGGAIEFGGICDDEEYLKAMEIVADRAKRTHDGRLLRLVTGHLSASSSKRKVMATPVAQDLRAAARLRMEQERRGRREQAELKRRAALDDLAAQTALEETKALTAKARQAALETARKLRQEVADRKDAEATKQTEARWLQCVCVCVQSTWSASC